MGHFSLVGTLIIVANEAYNGCVVCKCYQPDGRYAGHALVGVECVDGRHKFTALWGPCLNI